MKLYLAIILAISFLENFEVNIIRGTLGSQTLAHNSCVNLHTEEINIRRLESYEIHHHPKKVVILITKRGVKVCVPHDASWVNDRIRNLDQRNRKKKDFKNIRRSNNRTNRTTV
ncbi:PREDICTED: cytokine SCM-1 beta-like [Thamnophis sirtalis]|uniref:Cytokine SCM-1 beta-like n=1 Tax=Thamnophis sirtalis TaxID=35019 RepID=A0A6I9YL66_9SAUR|nr:PREDICTED: cytokine SCM-1 beta-like [Thamnophis sirtalis]